MTRSLFLNYFLNFVHWLAHYRRQLPREMAKQPAVLVCHGHNLRMNFAAMHYLHDNNVRCDIIPVQISHVAPPFDVAPFKNEFKKKRLAFQSLFPFTSQPDQTRAVTVATLDQAA